jgi:hypothetical protein
MNAPDRSAHVAGLFAIALAATAFGSTDNVSAGYFDVYDQYLINILYDPRIEAGMTVAEVKAVLPDVLADVRVWVRKANNLTE